jgi:hypothetical protein
MAVEKYKPGALNLKYSFFLSLTSANLTCKWIQTDSCAKQNHNTLIMSLHDCEYDAILTT